jgi:hypothetical protein
MADTLVERLRAAADTCVERDYSEKVEAALREAADHIGLLTRSLEMLCKQTSIHGSYPLMGKGNTSAQGDGSGE